METLWALLFGFCVAALVISTIVAVWAAPILVTLANSIHEELAQLRKHYADTAKTSAEAAATWAEVRRKMLRGDSRGEGN